MYIARDKDGDLYLYRERPVKHDKRKIGNHVVTIPMISTS